MQIFIRNIQVLAVVRNFNIILKSMDESVVKTKFRGCLMGALLGDCLGAPFEGDPLSRGALKVIQNYFDKLEEPNFEGK